MSCHLRHRDIKPQNLLISYPESVERQLALQAQQQRASGSATGTAAGASSRLPPSASRSSGSGLSRVHPPLIDTMQMTIKIGTRCYSAFRFDIPKFLLLPSTLWKWSSENSQITTGLHTQANALEYSWTGARLRQTGAPEARQFGQLVITICATRCEKIRIRTVSYACIDWIIRDADRAGLGRPKLKYFDWLSRLTFSLIHFT